MNAVVQKTAKSLSHTHGAMVLVTFMKIMLLLMENRSTMSQTVELEPGSTQSSLLKLYKNMGRLSVTYILSHS